MEEINIDRIGFNGDKARLILPDGYEFEAEGNEVFVIKKKLIEDKYGVCNIKDNFMIKSTIDLYKNYEKI